MGQITVAEPTELDLEIEATEHPLPGKSDILFQIVEGDSHLFESWDNASQRFVRHGLDFGEMQWEGGSAEIDGTEGMLEYCIAQMLDEEFWRPGWFVMEGYIGYYYRDAFTNEISLSHEYEVARPARWSDIERFGTQKAPLHIRIARLFGLDPIFRERRR
ncbi:hypothetical protein [Inquilinus sp. OTU3971]|uniref:hypothetical protein n=1 Tax=Inquilinus sp. OTU3971 TaxID=3043855 RepID=UPI00313CCA87